MEREEEGWKKRENGWEKREFIDARMDAFKKIIIRPPFSSFSNLRWYIYNYLKVKNRRFLYG
jgi:hypothetical protein